MMSAPKPKNKVQMKNYFLIISLLKATQARFKQDLRQKWAQNRISNRATAFLLWIFSLKIACPKSM